MDADCLSCFVLNTCLASLRSRVAPR